MTTPIAPFPSMLNRLVRRAAIAATLAAGLAACGSTSSTRVSVDVPARTAFTFVDGRPADGRASHDYRVGQETTQVLGDDAIEPPPADIVRAVLQRRVAVPLAGKTVRLEFFKVDVTLPRSTAFPVSAMLMQEAMAIKRVRVRVAISVDGTEHSIRHYDEFKGRVMASDVEATILEAMRQLADRVLTAP